jgi:protein-S-isoprenylcysteine O-methyltransferase Ste14
MKRYPIAKEGGFMKEQQHTHQARRFIILVLLHVPLLVSLGLFTVRLASDSDASWVYGAIACVLALLTVVSLVSSLFGYHGARVQAAPTEALRRTLIDVSYRRYQDKERCRQVVMEIGKLPAEKVRQQYETWIRQTFVTEYRAYTHLVRALQVVQGGDG